MEVIKASFVFVNDNPHTSEASVALKRKTVRAQAARQQAAINKSQSAQQVKSAAKWNKYQARKRNRHQTTYNTFQLSLTSLTDLPWTENGSEDSAKEDDAATDHTTPRSKSLSSSETASEPVVLSKEVAAYPDQQPSFLLPCMPGAGWATPFLPVSSLNKPYVPLLINHYLTNLATDIPELDAGTAGILRSLWFPMVITAEATANVVLLTAASHYACCHQLAGNSQMKQILLYLRCQTYAAVQRLIADSSTETRNDVLIGSVAKLASYEAMFGTPELYHLHIRNLQIMIREKGGLESLGLNGLLQRMVLWIDINSAFLLNSTAYFLPTVPLAGHTILQQPNPGHFLGQS